MNKLQVFNNSEFGEVRTIEHDGEPWFVGKDVAAALGYKNSRQALATNVEEEDRGVHSVDTPSGTQEMTVINESGLYSLVLSSKLPTAKAFKRWITSEVIPSIRKHGLYAVDQLIDDPELAIKAFTALKEEREQRKLLEAENAKQKQIIGELKPLADYTDMILKNKGLVTTNQIAKDYGMSARALNKKLHELGVQYKQSEQWLLYEKYQACGYTHSKTVEITHKDGSPDVKMHTKWTQKGRLFIYNLLKEQNILPIIEQEQKTA